MDEVLLALFVSVTVLAGTGLTAVFKGPQILAWLRNKEKSVKAAHEASVNASRART
jgi:hypothetical protein